MSHEKRPHPFRAIAVSLYERPLSGHVPQLRPHAPWWILAAAVALLCVASALQ